MRDLTQRLEERIRLAEERIATLRSKQERIAKQQERLAKEHLEADAEIDAHARDLAVLKEVYDGGPIDPPRQRRGAQPQRTSDKSKGAGLMPGTQKERVLILLKERKHSGATSAELTDAANQSGLAIKLNSVSSMLSDMKHRDLVVHVGNRYFAKDFVPMDDVKDTSRPEPGEKRRQAAPQDRGPRAIEVIEKTIIDSGASGVSPSELKRMRLVARGKEIPPKTLSAAASKLKSRGIIVVVNGRYYAPQRAPRHEARPAA